MSIVKSKALGAKPKAKKTKASPPVVPVEHALILRTCSAQMTSHKGFVWPESGPVEAPDWKPTEECGNGLHGFLWGEGNGGLANWHADAKWLVVRVNAAMIIDLGGKVKFPRGEAVYCGDRLGATAYLAIINGPGRSIVGGTSTSGDGGTSTSGDDGTSTSGDRGTSISGNRGTSISGDGGTIQVKWWDDSARRYRLATGYVGEDGLKAGVAYHLEKGQWIEVKEVNNV